MKDFTKINKVMSSSLKEDRAAIINLDHLSTNRRDKKHNKKTYYTETKDWDQKTRQEKEEFERELKHESHLADLSDRNSSRGMRERYALYVFAYVCLYSFFCGFVVLFQGFGGIPYFQGREKYLFFHIDDKALCILIGSTATAIIGLIAIVLKGLFPKRGK